MINVFKPTQRLFRSNVTWTLVGNLFYTACQWGLLIVLARLGSAEAVGAFSFGLALTAPVFMFTNLQLRSVQATDVKTSYTFDQYLSLRKISILASIALIIFVILVGNFGTQLTLITITIAIAKSIESISDIYFGKLQLIGKMSIISISMIIKGALSLLSFGITFLCTKSVLFASLSLSFGWLIVLMFYDIPMTKVFQSESTRSSKVEFSTLKKLALTALPLGFIMGLISLNANIPRFFLQKFVGNTELGVFSALIYLIIAAGLVTNAIGQAVSTPLAQHRANGSFTAFWKIMIKLITTGVILGLLGIGVATFFGDAILIIIYGKAFAGYGHLLIFVMIVFLFSNISSVLGFGLTSARMFNIQIPIFVFTVLVCLIFSLIMIPVYGLLGSIYALLFSSIAQTFGSLIAIYPITKRWKGKLNA